MKTDDQLHIIYVSTVCSAEVYDTLFRISRRRLLPQAQKYHRLMAEGLAAHQGVRVTVLSAPPITRQVTKRLFFSKSTTTENRVEYRMVGTLNIPIMRRLITLFKSMVQIWRISKRRSRCVIICDALNITISVAALVVAWLKRIKTVGIVTDVPEYVSGKGSALSKSFASILSARYCAYLFLTVQMNDVINKRNRPYVVIEGQVDCLMAKRKNELGGKNPELVCMYTGAIHRIYGIQMLADAFILADVTGASLQIYGTGDYEEELKKKARQHETIRFGGTVPNEQIVEEQIKATLLINPRPTNQEFTKYSFPSKNMEYIASGTPLLTTKLPGMPDDYLPYVYTFEEETVEGYAKTLREVLSIPAEELHTKGMVAKEFAMQHKNNVTQAGKLLKMIREEVIPY